MSANVYASKRPFEVVLLIVLLHMAGFATTGATTDPVPADGTIPVDVPSALSLSEVEDKPEDNAYVISIGTDQQEVTTPEEGYNGILDKQEVLNRQTFWDNKDWEWYKANIPFLETPDADIDTTYYYRWDRTPNTVWPISIEKDISPRSWTGVFERSARKLQH